MTGAQFDALVKLMRGNAESAGNRAARRVLVEGIPQAQALVETGASRSTVSLTVRRFANADKLIRSVYVDPEPI